MGELLFVVLIIFAILIVGYCLVKTNYNKKKKNDNEYNFNPNHYSYEAGGLEGVVMAFHNIIFVGGWIILIAGFFTKSLTNYE